MAISHGDDCAMKYNLLVMSGKGGVGKTTIAVNLAYALSRKGFKTGILDADIHGPNVPKMLNLGKQELMARDDKIVPIRIGESLKVMSMAFLAEKEKAVIWRGPLKHKLIKQFVEDVDWGELDYLVIDLPPGTGDEAISISQLLSGTIGSIIVSTPQQVALLDVARSINFSREMNIPIIGLVENMAGDVFGRGNVKALADEESINFLGSLGLNGKIAESGDRGKPFAGDDGGDISDSFSKITEKIISIIKKIELNAKKQIK